MPICHFLSKLRHDSCSRERDRSLQYPLTLALTVVMGNMLGMTNLKLLKKKIGVKLN